MENMQFLQRGDNENKDIKKLFNKQMYMVQLMNMKTRGRFFDETKLFVDMVNQMPSIRSQKKVVSKLQPPSF
jgi:hypothetical protein